jgi:hypothetical protein
LAWHDDPFACLSSWPAVDRTDLDTEREIFSPSNQHLMVSGRLESLKRWIVRERIGFVPGVLGVAILVLVIVTGGKGTAWLMWFAIPLLMLSLGYIAVTSAIPLFLDRD